MKKEFIVSYLRLCIYILMHLINELNSEGLRKCQKEMCTD